MSPRSIRRAAERKAQKEARKAAPLQPSESGQSQVAAEPPQSQSTGSRTAEGKQRSSQNSFKHGLYSKALVLPHECAAEFDELRAKLRAEHQPVSTTEEILVDELAQHFWRLRRFRSLEASLWQPDNLVRAIDENLILLAQRAAAGAERGFHKSLQALRQLQKDRKFIPQPVPQQSVAESTEAGEFVPSLSPLPLENWLGDADENDGAFHWASNEDDYQEFMAARERVRQFVSSKQAA